jgi:hypothetical protein
MTAALMRHFPCGCHSTAHRKRVNGVLWVYDRALGWHNPHVEHAVYWPATA